jgi:ABC-type antimicrobial peptide transport system permease subunit
MKLVLSQLLDNRSMFLLVVFEMVIALGIFNIAFSGVYDLWLKDNLYSKMELQKAVAFTISDDSVYNEIKADMSFTLLGESSDDIIIKNEHISFLSDDFIENVKHPDIDGEWFVERNGAESAVVCKSMSEKYRIGNTYKITVDNKEIPVYISGVLKSDYMFLPPKGESDIIQQDKKLIMIKQNSNKNAQKHIVTAYVNGDIDEGISRLTKYGVENVISVSLAKENDSQIQLQQNSVPILLTVAVLFMCIAGFASYNVFSIVQKERQFAVFFLTGASKRSCIVIQLIEDIITITVPMIIVFPVLFVLKLRGLESAFCNVGIAVSVMLCVLIFFATSLGGILKLAKREPIEIIRQW